MGRSRPTGAVATLAIETAFVLAIAIGASGCATGPAPSPDRTASASASVELTIFAAASLREAFADLAAAYESSRPGVRLVVTSDASNALRAQIETGAVADVFASADTTNPQRLVDAGSTVGPARVFAANELALVTPASDPAAIRDAYDLARPGVRFVAAGPDVPISAYTDRLIENLEAYRGAQAGLRDAIEANVVSREDNVRAVLAKIELGEGDAAFVYATDARGDPRVHVVPLPSEVNVRTAYAAVVPRSGAHPAEASQFLDWLAGPEAGAILRERGFLSP